jgi:hypothetical protein
MSLQVISNPTAGQRKLKIMTILSLHSFLTQYTLDLVLQMRDTYLKTDSDEYRIMKNWHSNYAGDIQKHYQSNDGLIFNCF